MIKYEKKINFQNIDQELINIFKKIESSKFPKGFLDFINYSVSELFVNIKEHSKAEIVWIKIDINMKNCFIESGLARIIIKDNQTISQKIPKGFQGVKTILKTSIKAFDFYKAVE